MTKPSQGRSKDGGGSDQQELATREGRPGAVTQERTEGRLTGGGSRLRPQAAEAVRRLDSGEATSRGQPGGARGPAGGWLRRHACGHRDMQRQLQSQMTAATHMRGLTVAGSA